MREPPIATRFFGHPIVAVPLTLAGFGIGYLCLQSNGGGFFPGVATLVGLLMLGKAAQHRDAYRAWKRAWDGMAAPRSDRFAGSWKKPLGVVLVAAMLFYMASQAHRPEYQLAFGWMVVFGVGAALFLLVCRLRGTRPAGRSKASGDLVRVIAKPVMGAPSLDAAYRTLPTYCRQVMGHGR